MKAVLIKLPLFGLVFLFIAANAYASSGTSNVDCSSGQCGADCQQNCKNGAASIPVTPSPSSSPASSGN